MACLTQQAQARRQSQIPFTSMCSGEYLNKNLQKAAFGRKEHIKGDVYLLCFKS